MKDYKILRPPLTNTFTLPSHAELLSLGKNSIIKLIFQINDSQPERMWVILTDCSNPEEWIGILDNDPLLPETIKYLKAGDEIKFHPLDIIQIH